jgi:hypothetical protein
VRAEDKGFSRSGLGRFENDLVGEQIFFARCSEIHEDELAAEIFNRPNEGSFSWQNNSGFLRTNRFIDFERISSFHTQTFREYLPGFLTDSACLLPFASSCLLDAPKWKIKQTEDHGWRRPIPDPVSGPSRASSRPPRTRKKPFKLAVFLSEFECTKHFNIQNKWPK